MTLKKITICDKKKIKKFVQTHVIYKRVLLFDRNGKPCGYEFKYYESPNDYVLNTMGNPNQSRL